MPGQAASPVPLDLFPWAILPAIGGAAPATMHGEGGAPKIKAGSEREENHPYALGEWLNLRRGAKGRVSLRSLPSPVGSFPISRNPG